MCENWNTFLKNVAFHSYVHNRLPWKYIKKARLLDTPFLYMFKLSVIACNVDVGNNGTGTGTLVVGDRGDTVVKVLCYKSEGRWFDSRWCHWNFSLT